MESRSRKNKQSNRRNKGRIFLSLNNHFENSKGKRNIEEEKIENSRDKRKRRRSIKEKQSSFLEDHGANILKSQQQSGKHPPKFRTSTQA
jgi:hypothetical protein